MAALPAKSTASEMIHVLSVDRRQAEDATLAEEILSLDKANMAPVFAGLGQEMPIGKRRLSFQYPGTIVFARDGTGNLAGYLEYGPGWENPAETYISSIQIAAGHRHGPLLLKLLRHAIRDCELPDGQVMRTHVQANNPIAIRLLEKIGFEIDRTSMRNGTLPASMSFPPGRVVSSLQR